jgi:asparagine synthetase B (glutamine-hydrolysing)
MKYHPSFIFDENPQWAWEFKKILLKRLQEVPTEYTLSFSAGIDSSMLLYGLMEINKPPKQLLTFQVEDYETNDLYYSRKIAEGYGIPLTIVKIPKVSKELASNIIHDITSRIHLSRKIDIQVCYAYHYMVQEIQTNHLVAGLYEDVIYETNAKLSIKYREMLTDKLSRSEFDEYYNNHRRLCYEDKNANGNVHNHLIIRKYLNSYGITLDTPLQTKEIFEHFQNVNYEQTNFRIENEVMVEKKKWFVTDVIFKNQFNRFGNAKNKSNFHTKKEKGDINTLHCEIFECEKKNLIGEYNKIKSQLKHSWF